VFYQGISNATNLTSVLGVPIFVSGGIFFSIDPEWEDAIPKVTY